MLLSDRFGQTLFEHQVLHVGERNHGLLISGKAFAAADIELVFVFLVGHSAIPKSDAVLNGINLILDYKVALRNQKGFVQHYYGKHQKQRTQRSRVKNQRLLGEEDMRLEICSNKQTDKVFVHLKPQDKDKGLMITPNGVVMALNYDLFTETVEIEEEEALANGVINRAQYNVHSQYW